MKYRIETDAMGEIEIPKDRLWGPATQRSLTNFKIGQEKMPKDLIYALVTIKKAIAMTHKDNNKLADQKANAIIASCDQILSGEYDGHFPLSVWQTGSGTQTNMNVNEVIASIANKEGGSIHPNDDVNKSQSTNDVFPSAIHLAAYEKISRELLPSLKKLIYQLKEFEEKNQTTIKVGRTHLQDATPISVGQEASAWRFGLEKNKENIENALKQLANLAIGGTAVGTGLNSYLGYDTAVVKNLNELTGFNFRPSNNKFYSLSSKSELLLTHASLEALATDLFKMVNDIRWLASGPRAGLGEYVIKSNEPGSSIMPGKVNPTQAEAMTMVCAQVFGNHSSISFAASQGNLQLNVFMPQIAYNLLQSIDLLSDAMASLSEHMIDGMAVNHDRIDENLRRSLMTVTALNPIIGYDQAAKLAKYAHEHKLSLFEANEQLKLIDREELIEYLDPKKMI